MLPNLDPAIKSIETSLMKLGMWWTEGRMGSMHIMHIISVYLSHQNVFAMETEIIENSNLDPAITKKVLKL